MSKVWIKRYLAMLLCITIVISSSPVAYAASIPTKYQSFVADGRVDYKELHVKYFQSLGGNSTLESPTSLFTVSVKRNGTVIAQGASDSGDILYAQIGDTLTIDNKSTPGSGTALSKCDFQISDGTAIKYSTTSLGSINLSTIKTDVEGAYNIYLSVMDNEVMTKTEGWGNWSYNGSHVSPGTNPGGGTGCDFPGWWYYSKLTIDIKNPEYTLQEKHIAVDSGAVLDYTLHEGITESFKTTSAKTSEFTGYKFVGSRAGYKWEDIANGVTQNITSRTAEFSSSQSYAFHYYYYQKIVTPPPPPPGSADIFVYYKDKVSGEAVYPADVTTYKGKPYDTYSIPAKPDTATHKLDKVTTPSPQIVTVDAANNFKEITFLYISEDPIKPPPGNQNPCAVISGPSTEMAGEEIRWNGAGSYDYDGEIVSYKWIYPGATLVRNDGSRLTVYYPDPGEYEIELEVNDDKGAKGYCTEDIVITAPYPTADIEISGTFKENRKVHIDGTGSSSPDHYPIDRYTWTFSDTANMRYQGTIGSTTKEFDAIFKTAKSYTATLSVRNTYGLSNAVPYSFTIVPDQNPKANFTVTTKLLRNPADANQALITISNLTTSPDSDPIKKTVVFYTYDSDNDGNFDEEIWKYSTNGTTWQNVGLAYSQIKTNFDIYNIAGGNPLNFTIKTNQVGKYKFEAMAIEDIRTAETIPALLTPSDYRRGDTFTSKPNAEKIVDIINTAPTVSFEIFKEKQTDIVILTDYTGTKLSNLQGALNVQKATLQANNINVNFTIVNTPKQVGYINDNKVWYRRYGYVSFIGDYSSWADRETNRHFRVPVLWEQKQLLESQYDTLPVRNPQNVEWSKSGEWDQNTSSITTKWITFSISCTNDIKTSGSANFRVYYNHDGNTQTITNIENISATVSSAFEKEAVIESVTTNVNSIDFDNLDTIPLREGSDRFALIITDNYIKDFTKVFGNYFPFSGLSDTQLNYFKNNGFKSYVVSPPKAVDGTALDEKIVDFNTTNDYTFITTIDGIIKRLGTLNDVNDGDLLYPTTVSLTSIKQILGDYFLQNDGVLKYYAGGASYIAVSGATSVSKIENISYCIATDGSLYHLNGATATDTGLDNIENIFMDDYTEFDNTAVVTKTSGGTYLLVNGVVVKTLHTSAKALWVNDYYISLGKLGDGIRGYYLAVLLSNGYFIAYYQGNYATKYLYLYDYNNETYQLINNMKGTMETTDNFWLKDGYAYFTYGDLDYNKTDYKYYFGFHNKAYIGLEYTDNVKKKIDGATMFNDGHVETARFVMQRINDGDGDYHFEPVLSWGTSPEFSGQEVKMVAVSYNRIAVLLVNGDVYTQDKPDAYGSLQNFAKAYSNAQGVYATKYDYYKPNHIHVWDNNGKLFSISYPNSEVHNIVRVQTQADRRILALTADNKLYGMGETGNGQLGIIERDTNYMTGYIREFRNVYNVMTKMLQPELSYITLRDILNSSYENKYFGSGQYQSAINDITNIYLNDTTYTTNYVLVNDDLDYNMTYADYESDPKYAESWINNHEPNYFENSMGLAPFHGKTLTAPVTKFDRKGRFTINAKARDNPKNDARFDNYRLWSTGNQNVLMYVHEKPVALARVTITNNGNETYTVKAFDAGSYDRDHASRADKGISAREWRWKESTSISWTNGQMNKTDCTADKEYILQLRVKDLEGVWSDYYTIEIDKDNPPVAVFNIDNLVIKTSDTLKVKDQSYPQSFSSITKWHWVVKKLNADGSVPAANLQNSQFANSNTGTGVMAGYDINVKTAYSSNGVGKYRIYLRVKNSDGLWSDGGTESTTPADLSKYYSMDFQVDTPPAASFTIGNSTIKLEEIAKIKDASTTSGISPLAKWHWVVKKLNANGSVPSANVQSAQFVDRNTGTGTMVGFDVNVKNDYSVTGAGKYRIYLRVMNGNGMWSDGGSDATINLGSCVYKDLTVDRPPTASFTIAKNPIELTELLKIKDTSSTAGYSPINRWHWIVKKLNADGSVPTANLQSTQFANSNNGSGTMAGYDINVKTNYNSPGVGKYRIYLRVRNSSGMWSDGGTDSAANLSSCVYMDLTVDIPPIAHFTIEKNPIYLDDKAKIKDTSNSTGLSPINRWNWIVKKLNADGSVPAANLQNAQFANSNTGTGSMAGYDINVKNDYSSNGVGTYRIYLRVRNGNNMWSDGGTDSAFNLNNMYSQDLRVDLGYQLLNFRVSIIRDFRLESYYKDAAGKYPDKDMFVNSMAIDPNTFIVNGMSLVSGFTSLTKGYKFEFEIDSKNFNLSTDAVMINPTFYAYYPGVPATRGSEVDLYWEDSNHLIHKAGQGGHAPWNTITLTSANRTINSSTDATWRGEYLIPGTAWAVPKGTTAANAVSSKMNADIIVNFRIRGYKNGVMTYDYNVSGWPAERTTIKAPYQIGDVIRYDHTKNNMDDIKAYRKY